MVSLRSEHPQKVKSLLGLFYRYYYMNASGMLTSLARPQDVKYHSEYLIEMGQRGMHLRISAVDVNDGRERLIIVSSLFHVCLCSYF